MLVLKNFIEKAVHSLSKKIFSHRIPNRVTGYQNDPQILDLYRTDL